MPGKRVKKINAPPNTTHQWLIENLNKLKTGEVSLEETAAALSTLPYEDIGWAKVDHQRTLRTGFPEVIFGHGKTTEQIIDIAESLLSRSPRVLITRTKPIVYKTLKKRIQDAIYNGVARTIIIDRAPVKKRQAGILIMTGGTSDIPAAEEAAVIAELMGNQVEKIFDVGVAGIHRLLDKMQELRSARVIVVAAGMEGALPGVIAGLVTAPIIAIPTSIGYGAGFGGLAPLLTMLNSCAPGVAVVNIDNGFGAGYLAGMINAGFGKNEQ
jgi:pyridinium-3,5-biscarboxylic acid mononucleotide synthase